MNALDKTHPMTIYHNAFAMALVQEYNTMRAIDMIRNGELVVLGNERRIFTVMPAANLPISAAGLAIGGFTPQVDTHEVEESLTEHARMVMAVWN